MSSANPISREALQSLADAGFGNMVKAVVDIERMLMVVGGAMHADEEETLLEEGSEQQNLWGINLYPALEGDDWLEFDSMINLRPTQGNRSRGVDDPTVREKIRKVIGKLVQ